MTNLPIGFELLTSFIPIMREGEKRKGGCGKGKTEDRHL